jgi:hypothetical protein
MNRNVDPGTGNLELETGVAVRRFFNDALLSAGALLIVLAALMVIDSRVRDHVTGAISGSSPQAVAQAGGYVQHVAAVVVTAARDQSIDHAPMLIFVVAATVLVLFMLRL